MSDNGNSNMSRGILIGIIGTVVGGLILTMIAPSQILPVIVQVSGVTPEAELVEVTRIVEVVPTSSTPRPTRTPTPAPLFVDNFNRGFSPEWQIESGDWLTSNDKLTIGNVKDGYSRDPFTNGLLVVGDLDWTNYEIEMDVDLLRTRAVNSVWLVIRYVDENNYTYLYIRDRSPMISDSSTVREDLGWIQVKDGYGVNIPNTRIRDLTFDEPFNVKVTVENNYVETRLNGRKVNSFSGLVNPNGFVGVGINSKSSVSTANVDNFIVKELNP